MPYRPFIDYPLEHHFVPTNGITLHVVQAGPTDGPLVILLHGFPEFWFGWHRQIPALAEAGFRVWVPDQRGYNLSDKPAGVQAYGMRCLSADIIGLIDAAGVERASVVGHDWGAAVAWSLGQYAPQRLHRLAVLNVPHPAVMARFLRNSRQQLRRSWYIFFFQIPWLPERLLARRMGELLRRSSHPDTFPDPLLALYQTAWEQPGALTGMINWYRAIFRTGLRRKRGAGKLPLIPVPTRLLWGVQDVALLPAMAQPSIERCEDGELTFFPQATHWLQHDEPEAVNAILCDFLRPS
jgi:pimeloyl-ACP methyl ester carboxylesterase